LLDSSPFWRSIQGILLATGLLTFSSCQYRWGQDQNLLNGYYSIGSIKNHSDVTIAPSLLQARLIAGLRQQSRVTIGSGQMYQRTQLIEAKILRIRKYDLEINEQGQPTEWQYEVECSFIISDTRGKRLELHINNRQHLRSSATYRPLDQSKYGHEASRFIDENQALDQAMSDLVQNLLLQLSLADGVSSSRNKLN
jgi:hypothetical protein